MKQIETAHGIFTDNVLTGQTAEEVYQEWLENKDRPQQPSQTQILKEQIATMQGVLDFIIMNY